MAEYDAFGNKIEQGGTTPSPVPSTEPSGIPAGDSLATTTTETTARPASAGLTLSGRPSRFSGGISPGPWIAVLVMLVVIGAGALIAVQATNDAKDAIRSFTPTFPQSPGITVAPESPQTPATATPAQPAAAPVGLGPRSLIRRARFASAIAKLRRGRLGTLTYVRVAADRIDAQLVTKGGRLRAVQVGLDGEVRQLGGLSGAGSTSVPTIPFSAIDTRAPERLLRGGVRRGGVRASGIDYLVMSTFGDAVVWNAYFKNGVRYQGDASGRVGRRF